MNIKDVKEEIVIPEKSLLVKSFFEKQKQLLGKYKDIEKFGGKPLSEFIDSNGKLLTIDTLQSQEISKNFSWRVTEEIAEGLDAIKDTVHLQEELGDGLHFLTELMIIHGITSEDIKNDIVFFREDNVLSLYMHGMETHSIYVTRFLHVLGMSQNTLKCKPWKNSQTLPDKKKLQERLINAYYAYFDLCFSFGFDMEDIYCFYYKKNNINNFRIKSNY